MRCVDEGIAPETIDQAAVGFGMPMGPIELADTVGLDICMEVGRMLEPTAAPPNVNQLGMCRVRRSVMHAAVPIARTASWLAS